MALFSYDTPRGAKQEEFFRFGALSEARQTIGFFRLPFPG